MQSRLLFFITASLLGFVWVGPATATEPQLLRSAEFGTVYYVDTEGIRHPFPNLATYQSWYGNDFSAVATVSAEILALYPLGFNITVRPGTFLVKVRTSPDVYAVEIGGVLRKIMTEEIAQGLYGSAWAEKVLDIPDVFFSNYQLGAPIDQIEKVPEGSLVRRPNTQEYYFLERNILQPFSSAAAVTANKFKLTDAITTDRSYYIRSREIQNFDPTIFNPASTQLQNTQDCRATDLRAAVIFLTANQPTQSDISKLQEIKAQIADRWHWASFELSTLDVSYPLVILQDDGHLLTPRSDGTYEVPSELINTFYEQHADEFDFLIVWSDVKLVKPENNEIARYVRVTNQMTGNGLGRMRAGEIYGSGGRLKGIAMMGGLNQYDAETQLGTSQTLNIVLHELLHQWGAAITFIDENGESNKSLLRDPDFGHWSSYVDFISPLGGSGWIDNGDGTFTSVLSLLVDPHARQFSTLDLYAMGLIPAQLMDPIFYLKPKNSDILANTIQAEVSFVDIEQVVADIGKINCLN